MNAIDRLIATEVKEPDERRLRQLLHNTIDVMDSEQLKKVAKTWNLEVPE